ncbi:MAG: tail fiber domain-containing protein [Candidatus Latescibacterota bacterium]|nr:MAG: tail fiber domain-containing protein [Candidatus Latescibacterota bacterium]
MRRFTSLVCVATAVVLVAWGATADVPRLINYQGTLEDDRGRPITGTHDLTFTIYPSDDPSPPVLWTETHTDVPVDAGLFSVTLGDTTAIPEGLFGDGDRWMGIAVDGGPEMTPRVRITSVPWSFRSALADSAGDVLWDDISDMPDGFADGEDDVGGAGDGHSLDARDGSPEDVVYVDDDGNVGVGTKYPIAPLNVASGSTVLFGADTLGAGTKLMWIPARSAFRVGKASGSEWDWDNIGGYSIAMGYQTTASGFFSTAMGLLTVASGYHSTAMGHFTTASGYRSTAMGYETTAAGWYSTAMGDGTKADSYGSTAIGRYNVGGGDPFSTVETDPLFEIGNGTDDLNRANAMTVLKNGNVEVAGTVQMSGFEMPLGASAGYVLTSDTDGTGTWQAMSGIPGGGIVDRIPIFTGPQTLGSSIIRSTGDICRGGIGIGGEPVESKFLVIDKGACTTLPSATYLARFQTEPMTTPIDQAYITRDGDAYFRGRIGVGLTTPRYDLDIDLGGTLGVGTWSCEDLGNGGLGCNHLLPYQAGFASLGSSGLFWNDVWALAFWQILDARLTENISDLPYGIKEIMALRPVSFRWRDHPEDGRKLGLIAQEVQPVISEVVKDEEVLITKGPNGPIRTLKPAENLGIDFSELIPVLIKAVQEQQSLIEQQAEKIQELESRIAKVEK